MKTKQKEPILGVTENLISAVFHTIVTLSAPSGHLPLEGKAYKVSKSPGIPLISGEWIVSHMRHEILRLSPRLFWLGLFTHRAFSSAQDDDTRGRKGSHLGDTLRVLELAVLYYDMSSPLL